MVEKIFLPMRSRNFSFGAEVFEREFFKLFHPFRKKGKPAVLWIAAATAALFCLGLLRIRKTLGKNRFVFGPKRHK